LVIEHGRIYGGGSNYPITNFPNYKI
jgi:hypothetical protein